MTDSRHPVLRGWPALDGGTGWPGVLYPELAIWGKAHAVETDYRWLASTPGFETSIVSPPPYVGPEDRPLRAALWWCGDQGWHAAMATYPSRAIDGAGRSGFVERRILTWKRDDTAPAALGALALLSAVTEVDIAEWWEHRDDAEWADPHHRVRLTSDASVEVDANRLASIVTGGIEELRERIGEEKLATLYAEILAGRHPGWLRHDEALGPEATAVILLPFPRELADRISIAGWLPSRSYDTEELSAQWDLVVSDLEPPVHDNETMIQDQHRERGREMASALLSTEATGRRPSRPAPDAAPPIQLALWGPSAAGKTALLAQLYIEAAGDTGDWVVGPVEQTRSFIDEMRNKKFGENRFPPATVVGKPERIEYTLEHRPTGQRARLGVEDRAGKESEELHDDLRKRLQTADGLVLLFDVHRSEGKLEQEIGRAIDEIILAREGGREERPLAVCLSKADLSIRTAEDVRQATTNPDAFMRSRLNPRLLKTLEDRCNRYRLFPVSAVGVSSRWGTVQSFTFYDEYLEPRVCPGGAPINLRAPFVWIFEELGTLR